MLLLLFDIVVVSIFFENDVIFLLNARKKRTHKTLPSKTQWMQPKENDLHYFILFASSSFALKLFQEKKNLFKKLIDTNNARYNL